jgi:hypothetical protein
MEVGFGMASEGLEGCPEPKAGDGFAIQRGVKNKNWVGLPRRENGRDGFLEDAEIALGRYGGYAMG